MGWGRAAATLAVAVSVAVTLASVAADSGRRLDIDPTTLDNVCAASLGTESEQEHLMLAELYALLVSLMFTLISVLFNVYLCLVSCCPRTSKRLVRLLHVADMKVPLKPKAQPVGT